MRDVYNKDITGNARFDNKLDPTGEQKKPSLGKLRQGAKVRTQQKRSQIKQKLKNEGQKNESFSDWRSEIKIF